MNNKVKVQVFGTEYSITTAEHSSYVVDLGKQIDKEIRSIMDNTSASLTESLVLLSLSYLDLYKKAEQNADNLRMQVSEYLEEAAEAKLELTKARAELERLSKDHQLKMNEA